MTYAPPRLPNYLASAYDLKPIVGVPTDDDVKTIHAVLRAVNSASYIPTLDSPNLAIQLAQHLFNAQMTVYRNKYPCSIFPEDVAYTPPTFPSHIPVKLEPVVGPPSDEQLNSVYSAVRALDSLANFAPMFDADLTMKLSQHLFDIQFARYIQQSAQRQSSPQPQQTQQAAAGDGSGEEPAAASQRDIQERPEVVVSEKREQNVLGVADQAIGPARFSMPEQEAHEHTTGPQMSNATKAGNVQEQTNRFLGEIGDTLKNLNRVLVSTQRIGIWSQGQDINNMVNQKGELPRDHGLPRLSPERATAIIDGQNITQYQLGGVNDQQLSAYLKFYNIGADLVIEDDAGLRIAPGQWRAAMTLLFKHLFKSPQDYGF